jgi:glutamate synthase domain-containing protein 3
MNDLKLKSILLNERIEISDMIMLEKASKAFAKILLDNKILTHRHKDLTSADVEAQQYIEDISEVVRNEVIKWMNVNNARSGR